MNPRAIANTAIALSLLSLAITIGGEWWYGREPAKPAR